MTRRIAKKTIRRLLDGIDEKMPEIQELESPLLHFNKSRWNREIGVFLLSVDSGGAKLIASVVLYGKRYPAYYEPLVVYFLYSILYSVIILCAAGIFGLLITAARFGLRGF